MIRTVVSVLFAALVLIGCSENSVREISSIQPTRAPTTSSYSPTTLTTVWTPPIPTITVPLADFKRMNDHKHEQGYRDYAGDGVCGWLYISEPYVNLLEPLSPDWSPDVDFDNLDLETLDDESVKIYLVLLPRSGTRYHPPSRSLWVWDQGPMTNGDYVCAGGSQEGWPRYPVNIHESNPWYAPDMGPAEPPPFNPETTH